MSVQRNAPKETACGAFQVEEQSGGSQKTMNIVLFRPLVSMHCDQFGWISNHI